MIDRIAPLKVLSYNIHKGFNAINSKLTLSRIKKAIESVSADLVFLQEVHGEHEGHARNHDGWPTSSQFEFIADQLWPHYAYGKNAVYSEGHHGNAILSKFPINNWENHDVSTNRFEKRGVLHCGVTIPKTEKKIQCFCLHFDLLQRGRIKQISKLCSIVNKCGGKKDPILIGGDFNDWRRKVSIGLQTELGAQELFNTLTGDYARTFPARLPIAQLDRIYFRGLEPIEADIMKGKIWQSLSDHAALFGRFNLKI